MPGAPCPDGGRRAGAALPRAPGDRGVPDNGARTAAGVVLEGVDLGPVLTISAPAFVAFVNGVEAAPEA